MDFVFPLAILLMSVVLHEVAHGYAARFYGDPTAEYAGRLTLNPIKHIDLVGSIIVPTLMYISGAPVFGWAKPVPYNPYNLKEGRWPETFVALAGPLTNIGIAILFSIFLRLPLLNQSAFNLVVMAVYINVLLAVFNLVPIPPLDGSRLLFAFFPEKVYKLRGFFDRYGLVLVLLFIFFAWQFIAPLVGAIFGILTGLQG